MKNLFDITDRVVVITGGAGILGRSICEYLAEQGAKVVILDRDEEAGNTLADKIGKNGGEAMFLATDVLNRDVLVRNREAILAKYGCIDILINAAGGNMGGATIAPDKSFLDLEVDAFKKVVDLNLFGTVVMSVLTGLIIASAFSAIVVYATDLKPDKVGMIAGVFFGLMFGLGGIGSAFFGWLADITSIEFIFKVSTWLPLLGIIAVFLPDVRPGRANK